MLNLEEDFRKWFPKCEYSLSELQKRAISNVIEKGNTLCIMPTGSGKSTVYWMAGLELGGISIIISPLTALIAEQAEKLEEQGYEVLAIYGGITLNKQIKLLKSFAAREITPKFIFLSPEKIATDGLLEHCLKKRKQDIKLLVIDEVHCVSQWGISFRPFYKRIPDFMNTVFGENQWIKILALTATLNPKEINDICSSFKIKNTNIIKQNLLMRSEIQLHIQKFVTEDEKENKFWDIINIHQDEKILVYVYRKYSKRGVEELCKEALNKGYQATCFHGDMDSEQRTEIINKFKKNDLNIVFATNAFGMGIDIPDINVVIHFMIPESVEQYYQEVGRAARNGQGANAYLLYSNKNIDVKRRYFIDQSFPNEEKLRRVYSKIAGKIGYKTLAYFDDEEVQQCLPYYLESGLIDIQCKGFADLKCVSDIKNLDLQKYYDSTKTKAFIRTVNQNNLEPQILASLVYNEFLENRLKVSKPLERWLIIDVKADNIDESTMSIILKNIEEKKKYKHELLDYFIYVLENTSNSLELHQEIASYLGTDKHHLNRIYKTLDGNHVRSKSEVIISNLLYQAGINYKYEEKLFYENDKWIEPDFTIVIESKVYYWEHVGMLGKEDYDLRWAEKLNVYRTCFKNKLIKTYENGNLSQDVERTIKEILDA